MNRTYRVIFNDITGTYVAVSEFAKAKKKSSRSNVLVQLTAAILLAGGSQLAQASFVSSDAASRQYGDNHVAIGQGAQVGTSAKAANNSVAIGTNAKAQFGQSTALGDSAQALGDRSTALGYGAKVEADTTQSIAIGSKAYAKGDQSTAIGNDTVASGDSSIAIGGDDVNKVVEKHGDEYKNLTGGVIKKNVYPQTEAKGGGAVAIGVQSQAVGNFSTAIGMTSKTVGGGSVAIARVLNHWSKVRPLLVRLQKPRNNKQLPSV